MVAVPGLSFTSQKTTVQTASDQQLAVNPNITLSFGGGPVSNVPSSPLTSSQTQSATQQTQFDPSAFLAPAGLADSLLSAVTPQAAFQSGLTGQPVANAYAPTSSAFGLPLPLILIGGGIGVYLFMRGRA